jgi:hypothetical protein
MAMNNKNNIANYSNTLLYSSNLDNNKPKGLKCFKSTVKADDGKMELNINKDI